MPPVEGAPVGEMELTTGSGGVTSSPPVSRARSPEGATTSRSKCPGSTPAGQATWNCTWDPSQAVGVTTIEGSDAVRVEPSIRPEPRTMWKLDCPMVTRWG